MVKLSNFLQQSLIFLVQVYSYFISPVLGSCCRFHPTCSKYTQIAIIRHGVCKGMYLSICRLLCCHPWHPGGYDPVPPFSVSKLPKKMS